MPGMVRDAWISYVFSCSARLFFWSHLSMKIYHIVYDTQILQFIHVDMA